MSETLLQHISRRVHAAGWEIAEAKEPSWLDIWHSNGDDQLQLSKANELWIGRWVDRDGNHMSDFQFGREISAECNHADWIAAVIVQRLKIDDPTCEHCGFHGHLAAQCDFGPVLWPDRPAV